MPNGEKKTKGQRAAYWASKVASTAGELAKGVAAAGQIASTVAAIIKILNSKGWYTHTGDISPAVNINRPMNPGSIEYMENNVTVASVPPIVRTVFSWTGWENSNAINLAIHKMYKEIRGLLRSNLPYKEDDVKAVIVNSIYFYAYGKQVEKSMGWALYITKDVPQFQEMHRADVMTFITGNVLAHSDAKLPWFADAELYAQAIADIPVFNSFASECLVPTRLMDMIAHYFGSYFTDQTDKYSIQYYDNWLMDLPFTDSPVNEDKVWQPMSLMRHPSDVLSDLRAFLNKYGMVIADMQAKLDLRSPRFLVQGEYVPYLIDDPTYFQALINAYTSDEAELDATNYFRLDLMEQALSDDLTPYLFIGALQKQVASTQNAPLFRTLAQYTLWYNELETVYPIALMEGFPIQGNSIASGEFEIPAPKGVNAVVVDSFIDSTERVSIGSNSSTGSISAGNPVSTVPSGTFQVRWNSFDILPTKEPTKILPIFNDTDGIDEVDTAFFIVGKLESSIPTAIPAHYLIAYGDVTVNTFVEAKALVLPRYVKLGIVSSMYLGNIERAYKYARGYISNPTPAFLIKKANIPTLTQLLFTSNDGFKYTDTVEARPSDTLPIGYALGVLNGYVLDVQLANTQYYLEPGTIVSGGDPWRATYAVGDYKSPWYVPRGGSTSASRSRVSVDISGGSSPMIALPTAPDEVELSYFDYIVSTQTVNYTATLSGTTTPSVQYTVPAANILAWYTSVVDKHIPIVVKHTVEIKYNTSAFSHYLGRNLLKETYIPYLYNILDLNPVTYNMTVSLLDVQGKSANKKNGFGRAK